MERRRKKRKKEIHAYRLVARHGREYEAGRERGGEDRFLKKRKSVLLRRARLKVINAQLGI